MYFVLIFIYNWNNILNFAISTINILILIQLLNKIKIIEYKIYMENKK